MLNIINLKFSIMKKVLLIAAMAVSSVSFAQDKKGQITVYGGLNLATSSTTDFTKFDISDWQNYGLLSQDPNSSEGRVRVDLSSKKPSSLGIGGLVGGRYALSEKLSALAELQFNFSGLSMFSLYVGANYNFVNGKKFSLGITPKVGYISGSADLGNIAVISGYTPPVVLPEGTFNTGDALSMEFSGLAANIGLTPSFQVSEKIGITGLVGYNLSFATTDGLQCNGVSLPMSAKGVVKSDGLGSTQAGINPKINASGVNIQIGISYKL